VGPHEPQINHVGHNPGSYSDPQRPGTPAEAIRKPGACDCTLYRGRVWRKGLHLLFAEEMLVPWAAMQTDRPLKWIEDRLENFTATVHERSQVHEAEIALDEDGRILGVKDVFIHDSGAYDNYGLTVPINSQCTLLGTYEIPNYYSEFKVAFTNKTLVSPYRGAGASTGYL
jgi:CO/xanthine dehydrogenase Mo-binding subunit